MNTQKSLLENRGARGLGHGLKEHIAVTEDPSFKHQY